MLQLLVLQLLSAWACSGLVGASGGETAAVGGAFGSGGGGRGRQEWWWFADLLSLPRSLTDETSRRRGDETAAPLDPPGEGAPRRPAKRACRSRGRDDACRRRTEPTTNVTEVLKDWRADYLSVPEALVELSQQQTAEDSLCEDLTAQVLAVDVRGHQPLWLRDSFYIGMCPSRLQTRAFGDNVWPPRVVESVCVCRQSTCSNLGGDFQCQALRRPITVWLRDDDSFVPSHEMVSIGCFCGRRVSRDGQYAEAALSS